jgi:hypothetical protein
LTLWAADGRGPRGLTGSEVIVAARPTEVIDRDRVAPMVEDW